MRYFLLYSSCFAISGGTYCCIELLYRQRTHYSMFFCAGFATMVLLFIFLNKTYSPIAFGLISSAVITGFEFLFGLIFNIALKMNVWDYSNTPFNIIGQICLPFSLIWFGFGIILYYIFTLVPILKI